MEDDSKEKGGGVRLQPSVTEKTREHLKLLAETGAFGKTESEVARTFIYEGIRRAFAEGFIPRKSGGI